MLPGIARLAVAAVAFAAVAGVGAVGLFGAVRGRLGGTAALPPTTEVLLEVDDSGTTVGISSSSGTSDSGCSGSLAEAMMISN